MAFVAHWMGKKWRGPLGQLLRSCILAASMAPPPSASMAALLWARLLQSPIEVKLFILFGLFLLVLFFCYLVIMINNERNLRNAQSRLKRAAPRQGPNTIVPPVTKVSDPVWGDTGMSRRSRNDSNIERWTDEDLPAIKMMAGDWGSDVDMSNVRQSNLIAKSDEHSPDASAGGVYVSGVNPFYQDKRDHGAVVEVADLQTQAELLAGLGDNEGAIKLLTRILRETEHPAPKAWLLLFALYVKTGRRPQYENLAAGFKILFNAVVPSWDAQRTETSKQLEDYPGVMEKVQRLWGMPTCRAFLESLLYDDRGGERQGFMLAAYDDIIFLIDLIQQIEVMAEDAAEQRRIEAKLRE